MVVKFLHFLHVAKKHILCTLFKKYVPQTASKLHAGVSSHRDLEQISLDLYDLVKKIFDLDDYFQRSILNFAKKCVRLWKVIFRGVTRKLF